MVKMPFGWNGQKVHFLISSLIFLFPLFAVSVHGWLSNIFIVLCILGLIVLPKSLGSQSPLYAEEKNIIAILISFFCVFLISSTLAGWDQQGIYAVGTEIRFLAIIPVYFLVRELPTSGRYLLAGCVISAVIGGVQGLIDVYYLKVHRVGIAWGVYGHLFIGPVTLLMVSLIIPAMRVIKMKKYTLILSIVSGMLGLSAVILSTARSAYLGFIVIGLITIVYYLRGRTAAGIIALFTIVIAIAYFGDSRISNRVNKGFDEAQAYFQSLDKYPGQPSKYSMGSIGQRLELWRATKYFFAEAPWFGVGRFNYAIKTSEYAKKGWVSPGIANASEAHNLYFDMLAEKGIFGLLTTLLLLYYPLYIFIRTRNISRDSAFAGIVLITAITVFSLTEAATFIKGNFVAIYLVFLSVFFSWHIREVYNAKFSSDNVDQIQPALK